MRSCICSRSCMDYRSNGKTPELQEPCSRAATQECWKSAETRKRSPSYSGVLVVLCTASIKQNINATWEEIITSPLSFVSTKAMKKDRVELKQYILKNDTAYIIKGIKLYIELET